MLSVWTSLKNLSFGNELTVLQVNPGLMTLESIPLKILWGKKKMLACYFHNVSA